MTIITVLVIGVVTMIVLLSISIKSVGSEYVAVPEDPIFGTLGGLLQPGIQAVTPAAILHHWPSTQVSRDIDIFCNNADGVQVELKISTQSMFEFARIRTNMFSYGTPKQYEEYLKSVLLQAAHNACGEFNTSSFASQRSGFEQLMTNYVRDALQNYTIVDLSQLQVRNIMVPGEYNKLVEQQQSATVNINATLQAREQQIIAANTMLRAANNSANILLQSAIARANGIAFQAAQQAVSTNTSFTAQAKEYADAMRNLNMTALRYIHEVLLQGLLSGGSGKVYVALPNIV